MGSRLPIYYGAFALFSLRIFVTPMWQAAYIPIISPVYWAGNHWTASSLRTRAILIHVACGVLMYAAAVGQFDATLRRARPTLHRWTGRVYVLAGTAVVASLLPLLSTLGQGRGGRPSFAMQSSVVVAAIAWLVSTYGAVVCAAVFRDFARHRQLMVTTNTYTPRGPFVLPCMNRC